MLVLKFDWFLELHHDNEPQQVYVSNMCNMSGAVRLTLNTMNIQVEGNTGGWQDYILYSPKDDLIIVKEVLPYGEIYRYIHIKDFHDINVAVVGSVCKVSFIVGGIYDVTYTTLSEEVEYIIRKLLKLPDEYSVIDTSNLEVFIERRQALRQQWIDKIALSFPYDIAEYMFNTIIAKDFPSLALGDALPQFTALQVKDMYTVDENITDLDKRLLHAKPKKIITRLMSYWDGLDLKKYDTIDATTGAFTWCTLYDDSLVQVDVSPL